MSAVLVMCRMHRGKEMRLSDAAPLKVCGTSPEGG